MDAASSRFVAGDTETGVFSIYSPAQVAIFAVFISKLLETISNLLASTYQIIAMILNFVAMRSSAWQ
jgi:hypothetical protein